MKDQNLTYTLRVSQSPEEVYEAVVNVRRWWTENMTGSSRNVNDEFDVRFGDVHYSRQRLIEAVPGRKIVWLVTESRLTFVEDQEEWTGTQIVFEISRSGGQTRLQFTHLGLLPDVACYNDCSIAWKDYIENSLYNLIVTGKGSPTAKEEAV